MAGVAPLSGSPSTPASSGIGQAPPSRAASPAPATPDSSADANFTAFPSSYEGFVSNGGTYGTVSVVNGRLSVVSAPAPVAAPSAPAPAATPAPGASVEAATPDSQGAPRAPGAEPPAHAPAPASDATQAQTGPILTPAVASQAPTPDATDHADLHASAAQTPSATAAGPAPSTHSAAPEPGTPAQPAAGLQPPSLGEAPANQPLQAVGQSQSDPTQGLIGSNSAPIAGSPASSGPSLESQQGFLGAPPTNPIVIQAEAQQRAAAADSAAAADQADAQRAADQIALQQINARIAAARAAGNAGAVAQLQPRAATLSGDIQGQTFAGLGSTPALPFARPEIPTVFLNIAS